MRLLFVCPDMRTGGAERHWATLIPELHERGTAVKLLALADAGPFFDDVVARGVPAECLHLQRHTNPRALRLALSVGAAFEPDAVVTRGVSGQLVGEAIARRADAVHVMNEHTPLTPDGRLVPPRPHQRALTRLVARRIDGVIAVTRRQVPPLEGLGYPRGRIEVVPNGVFERDVQGVEASPELANGSRCCACQDCGARSAWICSSRPWPLRDAKTPRSEATWPARARSTSGSSGSRTAAE